MRTIVLALALLLLAIAVWIYLEPTGLPPAPAKVHVTPSDKPF